MTEGKIKDEFSTVKKHYLWLILILMFLIVAEFVMLTIFSIYFCQISKKNPVTLIKLLTHILPLDGAKVRLIP